MAVMLEYCVLFTNITSFPLKRLPTVIELILLSLNFAQPLARSAGSNSLGVHERVVEQIYLGRDINTKCEI